jgi:hypothetical protein
MRQSRTTEPVPQRRRTPRPASATTAAGIAAERLALEDRERARRMTRARAAARQLQEHPASS